jgi:hypothetical protein
MNGTHNGERMHMKVFKSSLLLSEGWVDMPRMESVPRKHSHSPSYMYCMTQGCGKAARNREAMKLSSGHILPRRG